MLVGDAIGLKLGWLRQPAPIYHLLRLLSPTSLIISITTPTTFVLAVMIQYKIWYKSVIWVPPY